MIFKLLMQKWLRKSWPSFWSRIRRSDLKSHPRTTIGDDIGKPVRQHTPPHPCSKASIFHGWKAFLSSSWYQGQCQVYICEPRSLSCIFPLLKFVCTICCPSSSISSVADFRGGKFEYERGWGGVRVCASLPPSSNAAKVVSGVECRQWMRTRAPLSIFY